MNPLSKEALAALESLELDGPDAKDERRVRESLERAIGVALPVATLAAAGAATATTAAAATGAVTAGGLVAASSTSTLTGAVAGSGAATSAASGAVAGSTGTMTAAGAGAVAGSTGTMTAAGSGVVAGSTATLAAGTTAGFASTAALTSLGLGAKVVLFVAALGLGSVMTLGVKAAVTPAAPTPAPAPAMPAPTRAPPPPPARPLEVAAVDPVVPVEERNESPPVVAEPEAAPAGEPQKLAPPRGPARAPKPTFAPREPELTAPSTPPEPETPEVPPPPVLPTEKAGEAVAATEDGYSVVVEVNFPSCDAATEARAAAGARRLLRDERPEHALWLLSAYQRRCPSGRWSDEAWRVRLSSLCLLDRNTEAASLLEWVSSEYPHRRAAIVSELGTTCDPEVLQEK